MRTLRDLDTGKKAMITAGIVILLLLILALYGYLTGAWDVPIEAT